MINCVLPDSSSEDQMTQIKIAALAKALKEATEYVGKTKTWVRPDLGSEINLRSTDGQTTGKLSKFVSEADHVAYFSFVSEPKLIHDVCDHGEVGFTTFVFYHENHEFNQQPHAPTFACDQSPGIWVSVQGSESISMIEAQSEGGSGNLVTTRGRDDVIIRRCFESDNSLEVVAQINQYGAYSTYIGSTKPLSDLEESGIFDLFSSELAGPGSFEIVLPKVSYIKDQALIEFLNEQEQVILAEQAKETAASLAFEYFDKQSHAFAEKVQGVEYSGLILSETPGSIVMRFKIPQSAMHKDMEPWDNPYVAKIIALYGHSIGSHGYHDFSHRSRVQLGYVFGSSGRGETASVIEVVISYAVSGAALHNRVIYASQMPSRPVHSD